ncbi:MAG: RDD family protein [Marinobacter sp.]|uniref:RDD family protein n=1 Tax=Marinobacter sp. TaxID=50741 RepID=UPI003F963ADB
MPRRFHAADELLPPATFLKRSLAIVYDGLISIAVLLVTTGIYTMITGWANGWVTNWDAPLKKADSGQISGDPGLTFVLFLVMYLFFAYFWTRLGQTLGMQVWRIRIENLNGTSVSWSQALRRYVSAAGVLFLALLAGYYLGAATLFLSVPAMLALFFPINGLSVTDRLSDSVVVSLAKQPKAN